MTGEENPRTPRRHRWWQPRRKSWLYEAPAPTSDTSATSVPALSVGQVWRYRTRPGEQDSQARILLIEHHSKFGEVVHARLEGVRVANPIDPTTPNTTIGHVPLAAEAFRTSITELAAPGGPVQPADAAAAQEAGLEGYRQWREAGGGVFTLSIAETVTAVESTLTGTSITAPEDR